MYPSLQSFCQRYARLCKKGLRRFLEFIVLIKVTKNHWFEIKVEKNRKIFFIFPARYWDFLWHLAAGLTKTTKNRHCLDFILGAGRSIGAYLLTRRISEQLDLSTATQRQNSSRVYFESWDWKTKIGAHFRLFVQVLPIYADRTNTPILKNR